MVGKSSREVVHFGRDWVGSLSMTLIKGSLTKTVPEGRVVLQEKENFLEETFILRSKLVPVG